LNKRNLPFRILGPTILLAAGFLGGVAVHRLMKRSLPDLMISLAQKDRGDAPAAIREQVLRTFGILQVGYEHRDLNELPFMMQAVFARDRSILILGTGANEWISGYDQVERFIAGDWLGWGSVSFAMDATRVSASENVAWLATVGKVRFKNFDLAIRFTAVLSRVGDRWVFRLIQFQPALENRGLADFLPAQFRRFWSTE